MNSASTRCGYIAIIGQPNAGKSTLLNQILGQKVAIVSPKVQTTRARLLGIHSTKTAQLIFMDTPGIFTPSTAKQKKRLETAMVQTAWGAAGEADLILLIMDTSKKTAQKNILASHVEIFAALAKLKQPIYVALNKVDLLARDQLLPLAAAVQAALNPAGIFMISASTGSGCADLVKKLTAALPQGPFLYDPEDVTDLPLRLLAAELTREQLFLQLGQEVPYDCTVETEKWEQFKNGSARVSQSIIVARDSQKGIIIGKAGQKLKTIGSRARAQMAELVGAEVHLSLNVKVDADWMNKRDYYELWRHTSG